MNQDDNLTHRSRTWLASEIFPETSSVGYRAWGNELLLALVSGHFSVKKLEIKAGRCGGLQYHRLKNEVIHVISGQLTIRYDLGDGILREQTVGPNATIHFPPGFVHQECAVSDCVILEASTPHFNDRVRVEARYGLDDGVGLPSTSASEIELR